MPDSADMKYLLESTKENHNRVVLLYALKTHVTLNVKYIYIYIYIYLYIHTYIHIFFTFT